MDLKISFAGAFLQTSDNCPMFNRFTPGPAHPAPLPSGICYLNGQYSPLSEAKVSVLDRGFIFGDAIYEVVPAYRGRLFKFDEHMVRLERSLSEVWMTNPHAALGWRTIFERLLLENARLLDTPIHQFNANIYLQISRGVAPRDHVIPHNLSPTVFAMCQPSPERSEKPLENGVFCITHDDFRWEKAHIKTTSLMGAILAKRLSEQAGAAETVMFRDGFLSEAASSNVWVVKQGAVFGVPNDHLVLEGVRYGVLAQLCEALNIPFELKPLSKADVFDADELLLSSASKEILPITQLDARAIADARPGPIYHQLYCAYQALKHHE